MINFPVPPNSVLPAHIGYTLPTSRPGDNQTFNRVVGSMVGLSIGDALGASVEHRPRDYLLNYPVRSMQAGGNWGLKAGQWTDNTSMALCLASSILTHRDFNPYDQMVRYVWWYKYGYLSATGYCFDIDKAMRDALDEFCRRQRVLKKYFRVTADPDLDHLPWSQVSQATEFNVLCGIPNATTNHALARLAAIPLFYFRQPDLAVELAGQSARLTHDDPRVIDACRYLAALIVAAVHGEPKESILSKDFYRTHQAWFGSTALHPEIYQVSQGSYWVAQGYNGGISGETYVVKALEAALWIFWTDGNSFQNGVLNAVNLGDDTSTTAAIYGQLAGAYYGCSSIPATWIKELYAAPLIECIGQVLYIEGHHYSARCREAAAIPAQLRPPVQMQQPMPEPIPRINSGPIRQIQQKIYDVSRASVETTDPHRAWRFLPSPSDTPAGLPSDHKVLKPVPTTSVDWRTFPQARFKYANQN